MTWVRSSSLSAVRWKSPTTATLLVPTMQDSGATCLDPCRIYSSAAARLASICREEKKILYEFVISCKLYAYITIESSWNRKNIEYWHKYSILLQNGYLISNIPNPDSSIADSSYYQIQNKYHVRGSWNTPCKSLYMSYFSSNCQFM